VRLLSPALVYHRQGLDYDSQAVMSCLTGHVHHQHIAGGLRQGARAGNGRVKSVAQPELATLAAHALVCGQKMIPFCKEDALAAEQELRICIQSRLSTLVY
jgi:hypothetical protein